MAPAQNEPVLDDDRPDRDLSPVRGFPGLDKGLRHEKSVISDIVHGNVMILASFASVFNAFFTYALGFP